MNQATPDWFAARCGKVTASRLGDLMAQTRSGWGASRANYRAELVAERLTGKKFEGYRNAAIDWGLEKEPDARDAYCFFRDVEVVEVGFIDHPSILMTGASPDGLVGDDGLVEIKCPNTATHIATLLEDDIAEKYSLQMQWQMACTGRAWCDFVSFDPRMPESMQFYCQRVQRNQTLIDRLSKEVTLFLKEVDTQVGSLTGKYAGKEAA